MNNLGFSIDNLHIGDVRIKGQDETLIVGNENGGAGYILPEEKGTEGQVITMNADNTTSFQDGGGGGGSVSLGAGLGDDITVPYNSPALPLPPSFVGTQRVTYGQLPIGSSIKYYLNSRFNLDIPSAGSVVDVVKISMTTTAYRANGTFAGIDAAIVNNNAIVDFSLPLSLPINFKGYLKVEGYITRTSSDTITLTSTAFSKEYPPTDLNCQQWENQAQPEEITISSPQPDDYIEFLWEIRNDYYTTGTISLIRPSIYWALQNVSDATVPPTLTSDHTQLTNLNLGDAGHTQFALLQGRSGGQVLSGGITPANFLTLKSHTAGLNNMIVKDLNTSFEKDIDMTQRFIQNCSGFINATATTGIAGTASSIGESTTDMSMLFQSNQASIQQLTNQIIRFEPTLITASKNIDIGTNQILDGVNNSIDFIGGDMTLLNTSLTNRIVIASQNEIDVLANTQIKLGVPNASNNVVITSTDTSLNQALNMNNNNINNVLNINSASSIILNPAPASVVDINGNVDMGSNNINGVSEIVGDGLDLTIRNGSGESIILNSTSNTIDILNNDLNMNSNDVNNVSNVSMASGGSAELFNVFRINGDLTNSLFLTGNSFSCTANTQDVSLRCLNSSSCIRFRVGASGSPDRLFVCDTEIKSFIPLNMDSNAIENASSINGLSVIGGNSCGTSNSALLTGSTTETSILPTTFIGSRQVPPNIFQQGDTFSAVVAGSFGSQNGDTITIRLKGGAAGTTLLSSVIVPLNSSSASSFELDIQFSIRQTGAASVAEIVTNYDFTYNQSGGGGAFVGERNCEINSTTFDTTILNQLDITAQFSSANANNSIQTFLSSLHKIY